MNNTDRMTTVNLGTGGEVFPPIGEHVALIDADTIAFAAASSCEYSENLLPREHYTDEEWIIIENDPGLDIKEMVIYGITIDEAVTHCMNKIELIMNRTGSKDFFLHFTVGRESFRYTKVNKDYKYNRQIDSQGEKTRSPFGLYQIKQELCRRYPLKTKMWYECEADDAVWWLGDKYPDKYLVCAVDKDILGAAKQECWNYYERKAQKHWKSGKLMKEIPMKYVKAEDPELFWYHQCLTGDDGDGIIGIFGIGKAKAAKILAGCDTDKERWEAIVDAYEKAGRSMLDALLNMRMVRLDQYDPETNVLTLWDPRKLK